MKHLLRMVAALCAAAVMSVTMTACGGGSSSPEPSPSPTEAPQMGANISAFEKNPSVDTWEPVHEDLKPGVTAKSEARIVEILATKNINPRIMNAAAVDLTSSDFVGAMRAVHALNVTAQINPPDNAAQIVHKTSWLAWLFLALRSVYARSGIDVTNMDLRTSGSFVGQNMNLRNVDFSSATLVGGTWRRVDLTDANFADARVMTPFMCIGCTWGPVTATLKFSDGRWVTP